MPQTNDLPTRSAARRRLPPAVRAPPWRRAIPLHARGPPAMPPLGARTLPRGHLHEAPHPPPARTTVRGQVVQRRVRLTLLLSLTASTSTCGARCSALPRRVLASTARRLPSRPTHCLACTAIKSLHAMISLCGELRRQGLALPFRCSGTFLIPPRWCRIPRRAICPMSSVVVSAPPRSPLVSSASTPLPLSGRCALC
jgi:hypothetical protein